MYDQEKCTLCGGTRAEHEGRQHQFTKEGDQVELSTQRERAEAVRRQQGTPMRLSLPPISGTDGQAIHRLIELMLDKGLFTAEEALFILGVGSKPELLNDRSGYQDPFPSSRGGQ